MSFYSFSKIGTITTGPAYYPSMIDTSDLVGWPWTVTCFASTDHSTGGIFMYGAVGDPTVPANWESYAAARTRGAFDAFTTKPATDYVYIDPDTGDAETPSIMRVGTQFYLTSHDNTGAGQQVTRLAVADDLPLNFTRISANSGKILDLTTSPLNAWPQEENHSGYFRWGANTLPGVAFAYLGYGLFGGGGKNHFAYYGSDDAINWTLISLLEQQPVVPGADAGFEMTWNEAEPRSLRDIGGGEHVMLCALTTAASGSATRYSDIYEITISRDGRHLTRNAVKVIPRGASGAADHYEVSTPTLLEYAGQLLCIYTGTTSSGQNSLQLAVGSFDAGAAKSAPLAKSNYTAQRFEAAGQSALPAWLESDGAAAVVSSNRIRIPGGGGIRLASDITPSAVGWVELYVEQAGAATSNPVPIIQIGDTGPADTANGVMAVSYSSISDTQMRVMSGGASSTTRNAGYAWNSNPARKHRVGLRWDADADKLYFIGANRDPVDIWSIAGAPKSSALRPRFSSAGGGSEYIDVAAVELRLKATSGAAAPSVASCVFSAGGALLTLSADCLGDGTGVSVTANGAAVATVASRVGLNQVLLQRASGAFAESDTVAYAAVSSDLRSASDLVAIYDESGAATWGTTPAEEAPPDPDPELDGPTLYLAIYPSATATPTWDRTTGWSGSPVYTDSDASPTSDGDYTFTPDSSGLSAETTYKWYAVWDDGSNTSDIAASGVFETAAASADATANGATISVTASVIAGAASGQISATASGQTLPATASLLDGAASGESVAPGQTLTASTALIDGAASGAATGTATGATVTSTATLSAGEASGEAQTAGHTISAAVSLLDGVAAGAVSATASGATLTSSAVLISGAATGTSASTAAGATVTASASLAAGTAAGVRNETASGTILTCTTTVLPGAATGGFAGTATGALLSAGASIIPGVAGVAVTASGEVLTAAATLVDGAAIGGVASLGPGATVAVSAILLDGTATGVRNETAVGQTISVQASIAVGRATVVIPRELSDLLRGSVYARLFTQTPVARTAADTVFTRLR